MGSSRRPTTYVLVVEDNPLLTMAMVDLVEEAGCEAVETRSVADAIEILETRTDIRTVVADLDMRGSTAGMKFAAMIRDRWPPIELVLFSSQPWMERDVPDRGVLFGKPFEEREIVATLKRMAN